MRNEGCHQRGFAGAAEIIARQLKIPEDFDFQSLIDELLTDPENCQPIKDSSLDQARQQALDYLWSWSFTTASFSLPGQINLGRGFHEFHLPAIESGELVRTRIIKSPAIIDQIKARAQEREKRSKLGRPENRITIKALSPDEVEKLVPDLAKEIKSPVILLEESFTVTFPEKPNYELDMIYSFLITKKPEQPPLVFFIGEKQKPHKHDNEGLRIDDRTHPGQFKFPGDISLPDSRSGETSRLANCDEIATLLVIFRKSLFKKILY